MVGIEVIGILWLLFSNRAVGLMSRVFANSPGDRFQSQVESYQRLQKMVLDAALVNTRHYNVRVKWISPGNEVAPSPTLRGCSYWKRRLSGQPRLRTKVTTYIPTNLPTFIFGIWCASRWSEGEWIYIYIMRRVFASGPGDRGSISLLSTLHYKVRTKGKVEQSREWSSALPYTSM